MKTSVFIVKSLLCIIGVIFISSVAMAQQVQNASYPDDPALTVRPETSQGDIIECTLDNSQIYPGTARTIKIYVPKQYDGQRPACLLVCLDGVVYYKMTTVMDNLIFTGEMPVTIGVFIDPGVIKDSAGNVVRYNRSNEFDRIDGTFARFIETEVLPMVENITLQDGRNLKLSRSASDRAITGASSGGIASFVAAWSRPDLFSRVYCTVGTFVSMRGGHTLPALVRKTEPKHLRIFLHDGEYDAWNPLFGEWFEYNKLMESALNFAGYEYTYKWDRSKHNIKHGAKMFPDAMRWLWRNHPYSPKAGKSLNNMLETILAENENWEEVDSLNIDVFDNNIYKNEFSKSSKIVRSIKLHNGNMYGTDAQGAMWLKCKDKKEVKLMTLPHTGSVFSIYPDASIIVQNEKNSDWLVAYTVNEDGSISNGEQFYWLHNIYSKYDKEPCDMFFDTCGNLYVATASGIQVADQNGRVRAILPSPESVIVRMVMKTDILYVKTETGKIFSRKLATTVHNHEKELFTPVSQGQG